MWMGNELELYWLYLQSVGLRFVESSLKSERRAAEIATRATTVTKTRATTATDSFWKNDLELWVLSVTYGQTAWYLQ